VSSGPPTRPGSSDARTFTKRSPGAPPGFFAVEAAGLAWLRAAGEGSARAVEVHEVGPDFIVVERVTTARPTATAAEEFGRALAVTHAAGADAFGQPPPGWSGGDGYIGRQPLTLRPTSAWGAFYAEQRLLPYARRARDVGTLSRTGLAVVERVCERLLAGEFDDGRPPARIHGDLWSGNVMFTTGGVVLIDPAAHGGHGLADLGMLSLFGAPHLATITASYADAAGLDAGWRDLIGLHQLQPLLVHAVSHGGAYGIQAEHTARPYA
jgi:fructosamine-3-kinase